MAVGFSSVSKSQAAPTSESGQRCTLTGTSGNDVLNGTPGKDVICGLGGNDTINGSSGNDIIDGGSGNDTISAGVGNDTISGGDGNDRLSGNDGNDVLKGEKGNDGLIGGKGADVLSGANGEPALNEKNLCEKDATDTVTYCGFDNFAPRIVSATMSRTLVDSSTNAQSVAVTIHVTDDLMGVDAVDCNLLLDGSRSFTGRWAAVRTAGDSIDGTYICKVVIPAAAAVGRYGVGFGTIDKVGNTGYADQLTGEKLHGELEIMDQTPEHWIRQAGPGDHESPRITDVIFSKTKIDTSAGPATFSVQMKVTDDSSGVGRVGCIAIHNSVEYITNSKGGALKISGTDKSGIYRCDITLAENSGQGKWYLRIYTADKTNQSICYQGVPNSSNEWLIDDSLQDGAQPTTKLGVNFITQTGAGDDELPIMTEVSLDRPTVNTSAAKQTVIARVKVKDVKSGINTVELESFSPSTFAQNVAKCVALSKDGKGGQVWSCSLTVPLGSQKGLHAFSITLRDKVGNRVTYDADPEMQGLWRMSPFSGYLADIVKSLNLGPTGVMNTD
jgi:Ca2+-binding RTX toxin-like protein